MTLGLLVNLLPLGTIALILIAGYGVFYGVLEAGGTAKPAPPGSRWQVPSEWVRGVSRRRRYVVWGSMLGPGFATRNPYAGFWVLPLAVAAVVRVRPHVSVCVRPDVLVCRGLSGLIMAWAGWCRW